MAEGILLVCESCSHSIEAWSDGNPYYIDGDGKKHYAYHPSSERALCIGNDDPHFCLACGLEFNVDSLKPIPGCPKCKDPRILSTWELDGEQCPSCHQGRFREDPRGRAIS
jgi:hypothetical protein